MEWSGQRVGSIEQSKTALVVGGERPAVVMLLSPPGTYRPQGDTAVLARVLRRDGYARGADVLDIGTGSGALALTAWRAGARSVIAVDLSWRAVAVSWLNCRLQRAPVSVRHGDLFAPVTARRFDLIVANPPYVPAETSVLPRHRIARCWDGGVDGRSVLDRICSGAAARLTERGVLVLVHSAVCGVDTTLKRLVAAGMTAAVVDRGFVPFGPVMRARAEMLVARGLMQPGATSEELVVVEGRRAA